MAAAVLAVVVILDLVLMFVPAKQTEEEALTAAQTAGEEQAQKEQLEEIYRMIEAGRTDEALKLLQNVEQGSVEYYTLAELAYITDGSEEADTRLSALYKEAADAWPSWQHMQKMAGVACIYDANYEAAEYRLTEALQLDAEDAETWYYLGVLAYYEGKHDEMVTYFEQALERNLSETKQEQMLWYAEQAGDLS